mmetsp:Transcript_43148/g.101376  ORF Transcript_43148/g.101376 Transcript_43148/m.101376 type:complete len:238 (+) Transcript_43148:96-809(+)
MTSTVLIAGSGFIGLALKERLQARGDVCVRMASRSSEDLKWDITDFDRASAKSVYGLDGQLEPASVEHIVVACGTSLFGPLEQFTPESWEENVTGKLLSVSRLVLALVKEAKFLKDGGSITITTGQASDFPSKAWPGLAVNNAGLNAFVKCAGLDLPRGLRLNAVSPCLVKETALKAGLPLAQTVTAADAALVYEEVIFSAKTATVTLAGTQATIETKNKDGIAKTSQLGSLQEDGA